VITIKIQTMNFIKIPNRKGDKIYYYYNLGRGKGQRPATGVFVYSSPKNQIQKNHNKEALAILETKKSQMIIESQAIGTPFIPQHKFKANFLDYYAFGQILSLLFYSLYCRIRPTNPVLLALH
jgi:hypothetical protein